MITNAISGTMMDKYFTDLDEAGNAIADTIANHLGTELEVKIDQTRLVLVDEENKIVYHAVVKDATRVIREPYYTDKQPTLTC